MGRVSRVLPVSPRKRISSSGSRTGPSETRGRSGLIDVEGGKARDVDAFGRGRPPSKVVSSPRCSGNDHHLLDLDLQSSRRSDHLLSPICSIFPFGVLSVMSDDEYGDAFEDLTAAELEALEHPPKAPIMLEAQQHLNDIFGVSSRASAS